jgi:hypothetical protein
VIGVTVDRHTAQYRGLPDDPEAARLEDPRGSARTAGNTNRGDPGPQTVTKFLRTAVSLRRQLNGVSANTRLRRERHPADPATTRGVVSEEAVLLVGPDVEIHWRWAGIRIRIVEDHRQWSFRCAHFVVVDTLERLGPIQRACSGYGRKG